MRDLIPAPRVSPELTAAKQARLERENTLLLAENAGLHRELAAVRERLANALHPNTQEN